MRRYDFRVGTRYVVLACPQFMSERESHIRRATIEKWDSHAIGVRIMVVLENIA